MALTTRERNMVIGIVAVVVIAAIVGAFLLGRGTGDDKGTTAATTATQSTQTQTQTTATVVQTVTTPPAPVSNVEIIEQSINPVAPGRGTPILCTVRTTGDVASVKMNLTGRGGFTVDLNKGPTVNGVTNWTQTVSAPDLAGAYRYNATVTATDGQTTEGPGTPFTVMP